MLCAFLASFVQFPSATNVWTNQNGVFIAVDSGFVSKCNISGYTPLLFSLNLIVFMVIGVQMKTRKVWFQQQ